MIISAVPTVVEQKHPECLDLLKNAEIIAFNQDPAGHAPRLLFQHPHNKSTTPTITDQGFARTLHDGSVGACCKRAVISKLAGPRRRRPAFSQAPCRRILGTRLIRAQALAHCTLPQ